MDNQALLNKLSNELSLATSADVKRGLISQIVGVKPKVPSKDTGVRTQGVIKLF